jgi:hypothetical protein
MNGKNLVHRYFRRQPIERVPFLPITFYQAARIDGAPAGELIGEPARLSRAVIELARLLGADSATVRLESAVFAACGIELAWPFPDGLPIPAQAPSSGVVDAIDLVAGAAPLLETVASIKAELRGALAVVAVAPGPVGLARRLGGADREPVIAAALRALVDAACRAGAEIVVIEDDHQGDEVRLKRLASPIINTARYYSASVILATPQSVSAQIADALLLPAHAAPPTSAGVRYGILPTPHEFKDPATRSALSERIAQATKSIFVSLDDAAMQGREMSDIAVGISDILRRH